MSKYTNVDWEEIASRLPVQKNEQDKAKRRQLFQQFDPNGNGYLSLAEIDKGCRDVLNLDEIFDCKPAILRAYYAAKNCVKNKSKYGDDYVEISEFRFLLFYLRQYLEYFAMFAAIDTSGDRRIEYGEFCQAIPKLESWGVQVNDPEAEFKKIDGNGGGKILFDEFCEYAIQKSLDLQDDDDFELN